MKKIMSLCLLAQLPLKMCAEDLQFWNKLDIPVYYAVGNRANQPTLAGLQKLPAFNAKQENTSKSPVITVDNSQFPQLLVVQSIIVQKAIPGTVYVQAMDAPGEGGMLYEFKNINGDPIPKGKKLYVRLIQGKTSPEFTKQTYVFNNIDDADIEYIAGKGSKPFSLAGVVNKPTAPLTSKEIALQKEEIALPKLITIIRTTNKNNSAQQLKLLKELLQEYPKIIEKKYDGQSALLWATKNNQEEIAKHLLDAGANSNSSSDYGSALTNAVRVGNLNIVKHLIAAKADINRKFTDTWDHSDYTALSRAALFGHKEIAELLLKAGATPSTLALNEAIRSGNVEIVKLLMAAGAKIDSNSLFAALEGLWVKDGSYNQDPNPNPGIVKFVIDKGGDINAKKKRGKIALRFGLDENEEFTALEYAVENGYWKIVKYLLDAGAKDINKPLKGEYNVEKYKTILEEHLARKEQSKPATKPAPKLQPASLKKDVNTINTPQELVAFAATASPREILGVPSDADETTIGKAFRGMSLKFHPDKWPNDKETATDAYQRIVNARDNLLGKK